LWSDRGDKQARDSLRQALGELRSAFSGVHPILLAMDSELIAFDAGAVSVDALEFARLAGRDAVGELRRAAALYEGELLEGLNVRDPVFEEWLRGERQRYLELAVAVMKKLLAVESGSAGVALAQRLLTLDPLQEEGHRALMQVPRRGRRGRRRATAV
jgi:DNA-binding SARP family transcriptional activator